MPIITLTTDWNAEDYYIGVFKGKILSQCNDVTMIDISHRVSPFNTSQAAFVLRNSFFHFPENTIHIIFVNTEPSDSKPFLLVRAKGHYFIGADNGVFDLIINEDPEWIIKIAVPDHESLRSFSAFDIFAKTASDIANGKSPVQIGTPLDNINRRTPLRAAMEDKSITGSIIYIDSFNNAISNITRELFERVRKGREFEIYVQSKHYKITSINNYYHETTVGELLAIFNSAGLLEIAINNGSAARLLNLEINSTIRVEFKNT